MPGQFRDLGGPYDLEILPYANCGIFKVISRFQKMAFYPTQVIVGETTLYCWNCIINGAGVNAILYNKPIENKQDEDAMFVGELYLGHNDGLVVLHLGPDDDRYFDEATFDFSIWFRHGQPNMREFKDEELQKSFDDQYRTAWQWFK